MYLKQQVHQKTAKSFIIKGTVSELFCTKKEEQCSVERIKEKTNRMKATVYFLKQYKV